MEARNKNEPSQFMTFWCLGRNGSEMTHSFLVTSEPLDHFFLF